MPVFELKSQAGEQINLVDIKERLLLLVFSRKNCDHCIAIQPALIDLAIKIKTHRASVHLLLILDQSSELSSIPPELLEFAILDVNSNASSALGVTAVPTAITMDSKTKLVEAVKIGELEISQLLGRL